MSMNNDILFVMIPKTGTTTMIKTFVFDHIKKHSSLNYLQLECDVNLNNYKHILATVRNPWQRNFSLYHWAKFFKHIKNMTFSEWLYNPITKQYNDSLNNNPLQQKNYFLFGTRNI